MCCRLPGFDMGKGTRKMVYKRDGRKEIAETGSRSDLRNWLTCERGNKTERAIIFVHTQEFVTFIRRKPFSEGPLF